MNRLRLAVLTAIALATPAVNATGADDIFSIRGYSTLGVAHSDLDQADFVRDYFMQPKGAGYSDSWSVDVDTRSALQLDATFTPRLSAVVQLVSEPLYNNSWDGDHNKRYVPSLEWANLSYKVTDEVTVRAGRIVLPFLQSNGYRKVGYANHWLRSPVEVYGYLPVTSSDGADITFTKSLDGVVNTLNVYYGVQSSRTVVLDKTQSAMWGAVYTLTMGDFSLRPSYLHAVPDQQPTGALVEAFSGFAAGADAEGAAASAQQARDLAYAFGGYKVQIDMYGLSASYDPGKWFAIAELVSFDTDSEIINAFSSGYVTGGVRLASFTPYATFAKVKPSSSHALIPTAGLSAPLSGAAAGLNGVVGIVTASVGQQTTSVGLRWDVASSVAVKFQYDYVDLAADSRGLLANHQPGFVPGSNFNVFGFAVDFVF